MEREDPSRSQGIHHQDRNLPENQSRRIFLQEAAGITGTAIIILGGLYLGSKIPRSPDQSNFTVPPELNSRLTEALQGRSCFYAIRHDATIHDKRDPNRLNRVLTDPEINFVETDVIGENGILYSAHSLPEFRDSYRDDANIQNIQELSKIISLIIKSGKSPAFDIKNLSEEEFTQLINLVTNLVPDEVATVFTGQFKWVKEIRRPNSIVLPTVNYWQLEDYDHAATEEWPRSGAENVLFGANLNHRLFDDVDVKTIILRKNREYGYLTNAYTVNNAERVLQLLDMGITGISSDNEELIRDINRSLQIL